MAKKSSAVPCSICGEYCTGRNVIDNDKLCARCLKIVTEKEGFFCVEDLIEKHERRVDECSGSKSKDG